jgi:hypothetical protein
MAKVEYKTRVKKMSQSLNLVHIVRTTCLVGMLLFGGAVMAESSKVEHPKRVVLVGASVGRAWHFDRIGERIALPGYRFDYFGVGSFDKGPLIQQLVTDQDKPDIVLIKECAAYFPGDTEQYQRQLMSWVETLRAVGIQVVLVTVAPVAEPTEYISRAKVFVKRLIGKPTPLDRLGGLAQFNDWLKQYAQRERIPVFDLAAQLQRSASERWLRSEYDIGDQLHLNEAAYRVLDGAFAKFLTGWEKGSY